MFTHRTFSFLAVGTMLLASAPAMADLVMGVFPRNSVAETHKAFQPLADHLTKELGETVTIKVGKDFNEFWKGVEAKEYDLVHFNQYHYVRSHKEQGYKVIAVNEEKGSSKIAGALAVRKDSGISSVKELKGKTILFAGDDKAMGSFIAPTSVLKQAGLEAGKDYKVEFAKNPPSAVIAVFNKAADAAGTGNVILGAKAVTEKIDATQMTILAESDQFIQLPWAVKDGVAAAKATKIQAAMSGLKGSDAGKEILQSAGVTGFVAAKDADFDSVRKMIKSAVGENY